MLKTLVVVGTVLGSSLLPLAASAQTDARHCPPGYQINGPVCQDASTGDVVLPD